MRIVCTSDTHTLHHAIQEVPDGDVLVHAGDFLNGGFDLRELVEFNDWLGSQPHRYKVVIAGNHDHLFEKFPELARSLLYNATYYLENSGAAIEGFLFWGSPVQPEFMDWAFNVPRGPAIRRYWDMIPTATDVLITHGPPLGVLDRVHPAGEHLGCLELTYAIERVKPQLHVFGHIHGGAGFRELLWTKFVNAAFLNEAYKPTNAPRVIDLERPRVSPETR